MSARLDDAQLTIRPGDSIPVRAAKVSLKTGRRLKKNDDPKMVAIVTGQRPSVGSARKTPEQRTAAPAGTGSPWLPLYLWQDLFRSSSSTGHPQSEDHAILLAELGRGTVMHSLLDEDEMRELVQHYFLEKLHPAPSDDEAFQQEQVEDWRSGRWPT